MCTATVGQRRSFDDNLCTVRYVGGVQGTTGDWLGVEWDDPTRGKHSGEHNGVRYFTCRSTQPTAGSFVRPSRPSDPPRSFLEALREKYASEFEQELARKASSEGGVNQKTAIEISGKVVEEVGFDKIRKQLAELEELRIVLLDELRIVGVNSSYDQTEDSLLESAQQIQATCPKIIELDLSRNLLSRWRDVWEICNQLKQLKRLKLNGNRFQPLEEDLTFENITELHLEDTLLTWDEIAAVSSRFPALTSLTASANQLTETSRPLPDTITSLTLEYNEISSLSALRHLAALPKLTHLSLRGNCVTKLHHDTNTAVPDFHFPTILRSLDLSRNNIAAWNFLNHLSALFPGLASLRISGNPLYDQPPLPPSIAAATSIMTSSKPMTVDEAFMLTLSRLPPTLRTLNFSTISPQDRANAEMYYLSLIGKELSATSAADEPRILAAHPRYKELCEQYGEPSIARAVVADSSGARTIHPRSVAARLVKMAFYSPVSSSSSTTPPGDHQQHPQESSRPHVCVKDIPSSFDTYQVKALVSRLFGLRPYGFRLFWETNEWDPVEKENVADAGIDGDDDSEDETSHPQLDVSVSATADNSIDTSRFVRREVELVDSTRDIGFLFQGETGEMKIRVEV
ncbi:hypothetical protein NUU61_007967 [Penicillium alfredii]|uniref:Leucine-rich repeat-containing protein 51 n=1 Tax=Penicillium alfredii TaxID=1506179 RepID=A0A9W9ERR7_9EURO|nr:uncharacterized protein NUU61_007967 [Penicillium alfredii]KAJ5086660.1 hypothetical protein NUU61_007967 [Penicillium alfredii]